MAGFKIDYVCYDDLEPLKCVCCGKPINALKLVYRTLLPVCDECFAKEFTKQLDKIILKGEHAK